MNEFEEKQTVQLTASSKRQLMTQIGQLPDGLYDIQIKRRQRGRTLDQNGYYFAAVVQPFAHWLTEQWGETVKKEDAHKALAGRILGTHTLPGGIEIPMSTKGLPIDEFSAYIENCARFLAEFTGIVVIPSEVWWNTQQDAAA